MKAGSGAPPAVTTHAVAYSSMHDLDNDTPQPDDPRETTSFDRRLNETLDEIHACQVHGFTILSGHVDTVRKCASDQLAVDIDHARGLICLRSHAVAGEPGCYEGTVQLLHSGYSALPLTPRCPWILPMASATFLRRTDQAATREQRHGATAFWPVPSVRVSRIDPLAVQRWTSKGRGYADASLSCRLAEGMSLGIRATPVALSKNMSTAYQHKDAVQDWFDKEMRLGGLIGPWTSEAAAAAALGTPFIGCGSLGVVTKVKLDGSIKTRVVDDLSATRRTPDGKPLPSTNEACRREAQPGARMPTTQLIKGTIERLSGRGTRPVYFGRLDLERAFRQLGIPIEERPRMCVHFDRWDKLLREGKAVWVPDGHGESGRLFFANASTSMGHTLASCAFQRVSCAIAFAAAELAKEIIVYTDDIIYFESSLERAETALQAIKNMLTEMGIAYNAEKCLEDGPPSTSGIVLGIHYDSLRMTMSIPRAKVAEVRRNIQSALDGGALSLRDLESVYGQLIWCAGCIEWGALYTAALRDCLRLAMRLHREGSAGHYEKRFHLAAPAREELGWWLSGLERFNGVGLMDREPTRGEWDSYTQYSDASTTHAAGGWTSTSYLVHHWSEKERKALARAATWRSESGPAHGETRIDTGHVNVLEALAFLLCFECFTRGISGVMVPCYIDNEATVHWLTNRGARHPLAVQLLREVHALCLERGLRIHPVHLGTKANVGADHLSHGRVSEFLSYALTLRLKPAPAQASTALLARWMKLLENWASPQ